MSDPNFPPPPGGGNQPPPPPGGGAPPPPPGGQPPPPGGGTPPPPGGFGGGQVPPAQPYQGGGAPMGPGGAPLAEGWKRILAYIIDAVILWVVTIPVLVILGGGLASTNFDVGGLIAGVAIAVVWFLYFAFMISTRGQTVGGMALKVKVVDGSGAVPSQESSFKRAAWLLLQLVPCLGGLAMLVLAIWGLVNLFSNEMRQTPWDMFGETYVVDA